MNIAWVTCILPQEMAFRSQVVPRNYFLKQHSTERVAISLHNQVHTTPHPVLQFLGDLMVPVQ